MNPPSAAGLPIASLPLPSPLTRLLRKSGPRFGFLGMLGPALAIALTPPPAVAATAQMIVAPAVGGALYDSTADGVFESVTSGSSFGVGKANNFVWAGSREYQGAFEWDMNSPAIAPLTTDSVLQVILSFTRGARGSNPTAPDLLAAAAGYTGDGVFSADDAGQGSPIASFWIYNSRLASPTWPNPSLDITSYFKSTLASDTSYFGINFRLTGYLPPVNTLDNWFSEPRLTIVYQAVPEPAPGCLAGATLIGFLGRRRRIRN